MTPRTCPECGAPLTTTCPDCGTELSVVAKFCSECGRRLAPAGAAAAPASRLRSPEAYTPKHLAEKILTSRTALEGERKLVTVLFCDLTGSTALAERLGPEAMHTLLSRFFDLALTEVHRYEGTINQFLGDGFMALFGAPVAHEDHARRAVLAAWAIQRGLEARQAELDPGAGSFDQSAESRLSVRMGLNTGHVVVGKIGDNLRMDYTAIGDATNLAARLQQIAEPGTILLSEATSRLVRDDAVVEPLEPVQVKGKTAPVTPYRLVGLESRPADLTGREGRGTSRFVGRERELRTLTELAAEARAGRGHVVDLVGEAGAGKSRLLLELRRERDDQGPSYLAGRCVSHGAAIPYLPALDVLRALAGIGEGDRPEAVLSKVGAALAAAGMTGEQDAPLLQRILGLRAGTEALDLLSPEALKLRTAEILGDLVLGGRGSAPRIVVIEDLQWIDETSEEWLASVVERLPGRPVLLVLSHRPGYRPRWASAPWRTELSLGRLSPLDSLSLVTSVLLTVHLPDTVIRDIIQKAEGNPLFLEEMTRVVMEHPDLHTAPSVTDTIQGVLMARIDRLREAPRLALQTASVLGREFPRRLLAAIWTGPGSVDQAIRELCALDLLIGKPASDEPTYLFRQGLMQEVAYASLLTSRRQALHAAAGEALETLHAGRLHEAYEQLAYHYSRTERASRAIEFSTRVAEKAAGLSAHEEAARALEEALSHVGGLPAGERDRCRLDLALARAQSLYFLGRSRQILDLLLPLEATLTALADDRLAGQYHVTLSRTYSLLGDQAEAAGVARRGIAAAERAGDLATAGKGYLVLAYEAFCSGEPRRGLDHARQVVSLLERADDHWGVGMGYWAMAMNQFHVGDFEAALDSGARAGAIGEAMGDTRLMSYAAWTLGYLYAARGESEAAIQSCERARELARDPFNAALARGFLGFAYLETDPSRAIPLLERAAAEMSQFGFRQNHGLFFAFLSRAYLLSGNVEHARELAAEAVEITRAAGYGYALGWALRGLGQAAQRRGRFGEALAHFTEALATFTRIEARFEEGRTHLALAELAHTQWNPTARLVHLESSYTLFRATGATGHVERIERRARELGVSLVQAAA